MNSTGLISITRPLAARAPWLTSVVRTGCERVWGEKQLRIFAAAGGSFTRGFDTSGFIEGAIAIRRGHST
jgi:hypothetical protein